MRGRWDSEGCGREAGRHPWRLHASNRPRAPGKRAGGGGLRARVGDVGQEHAAVGAQLLVGGRGRRAVVHRLDGEGGQQGQGQGVQASHGLGARPAGGRGEEEGGGWVRALHWSRRVPLRWRVASGGRGCSVSRGGGGGAHGGVSSDAGGRQRQQRGGQDKRPAEEGVQGAAGAREKRRRWRRRRLGGLRVTRAASRPWTALERAPVQHCGLCDAQRPDPGCVGLRWLRPRGGWGGAGSWGCYYV